MRKSKIIPLLLIGTMALAIEGCSDEPEELNVDQNKYASVEDCVKDWQDQSLCTRSTIATAPGGHFYYYGPQYYYDHAAGHPMVIVNGVVTPAPRSAVTSIGSARAVTSVHTTAIARGGFGVSAHAASVGG